MHSTAILLLIACLQLTVTFSQAQGDSCKDACKCGDISWESKFEYPLNFTKSEDGIAYSYTFSPCANIPCGDATVTVVMCQYDPSNNDFVVVGTATKVSWDIVSPTEYVVVYGGGTPTFDKKERMAFVSVNVSTEGENAIISNGEDDSVTGEIHYLFNTSLNSNTPLPGGESAAGVIEIVVMFLLIAAVIAYFVIGGIVMYTVKGARGVEVIPQYTFWKSLPFLIKDGIMFTVSPCTSKCRGKSTYSPL